MQKKIYFLEEIPGATTKEGENAEEVTQNTTVTPNG